MSVENKKVLNGVVVGIVFLSVLYFVISSYFSPTDFSCEDCNVLLITIDSQRWDHLGYMDYHRNTSPVLDHIASDGVVFTKAFAQSSFTPPSLGSLMTSKYVSDHGLKAWNKLSDEHVTLPEILSASGYKTAAFTRVPKLFEQNLDQGIDFAKQGNYWRAWQFNKAALGWLDDEKPEKFFMWLHYYDPHRRYEPPKPFDKKFNRRYNLKTDPQRNDKNYFNNFWKGKLNISKRKAWGLITQYDGEIAYTDQQIGALLNELDSRGLLDNTIVVISADHGESLNEHPDTRRYMFSHDPILFDQVTRIPLIFWGKNMPKGLRIDSLVESIDIAPTILSLLGITHEDSGMLGEDMSILFDGVKRPFKSEVYSECWGWETRKMIRTQDHKLIRDLKKKTEELYDLSGDPGEKKNIIKSEEEVAKGLSDKLDVFMARHKHTPLGKVKYSKELENRLKELGYLD